jgi:hypothetical protein
MRLTRTSMEATHVLENRATCSQQGPAAGQLMQGQPIKPFHAVERHGEGHVRRTLHSSSVFFQSATV